MISLVKKKVRQIGKERIIRLSKESTLLVFGQVVSILSSVLLVKILANNLTPLELGNYSLALTIGAFVCQITFSYTMPGIARYFSLSIEKRQQKSFFNDSTQLMFQSSKLSILLGCIILIIMWLNGRSEDIYLSILAIFLLIITNFNTIFTEFQNTVRQRHIAVYHSTLDSILKIIIIFILLKFTYKKAYIVIFGSVLSLLIVLFSQKHFINKIIPKDNLSTNKEDWKILIKKYSIPFLYFNFFTGLQSSADRWALDYFTNRSEVGLFSPLTQLGYTPLLLISGLTTTLFGPILFKKSGDGTSIKRNLEVSNITNTLAFLSLFLTFLIFIVTFIFHNLIFEIFVNKNYYSVSYLLPFMVLSGGFFSTGQIYSLKLMSDLKTKSLVLPKIITSILGVILSITGAYFAGIKGVVICSLIFSTLQLIWIGIISNKNIFKIQTDFL